MKGLIIAIIIISCLFLITVGILIYQNFLYEKKITKMTIDNDEFKKNFIEELKELKKIKPLTIKEITILSDEEKTQKIIELQNDKEKLIKLAEEAQIKLDKANEELKKKNKLHHELSPFALAGIGFNRELPYNYNGTDIYIGLKYKYIWYPLQKFSVGLGGGVAVKLYQDVGIGGIVECSFKF